MWCKCTSLYWLDQTLANMMKLLCVCTTPNINPLWCSDHQAKALTSSHYDVWWGTLTAELETVHCVTVLQDLWLWHITVWLYCRTCGYDRTLTAGPVAVTNIDCRTCGHDTSLCDCTAGPVAVTHVHHCVWLYSGAVAVTRYCVWLYSGPVAVICHCVWLYSGPVAVTRHCVWLYSGHVAATHHCVWLYSGPVAVTRHCVWLYSGPVAVTSQWVWLNSGPEAVTKHWLWDLWPWQNTDCQGEDYTAGPVAVTPHCVTVLQDLWLCCSTDTY